MKKLMNAAPLLVLLLVVLVFGAGVSAQAPADGVAERSV